MLTTLHIVIRTKSFQSSSRLAGDVLPLSWPDAEAGVHALKDVLFVFAAADAVVEVPAHQAQQPRREPFPDDPGGLVPLAAIGRTQTLNAQGERTHRAHASPRSVKRTRGNHIMRLTVTPPQAGFAFYCHLSRHIP